MMKLLYKFAFVYLLAVLFYSWGLISMQYNLFPWTFLKPKFYEIMDFLAFNEGLEKNLLTDKIMLGHQEKKTKYNFSGLQYRDKNFRDDGYILISRYSKIHRQVIIELLSIEQNIILFTWIPPLKEIFKITPEFNTGHNTRMAYRAQNPLLLPQGDIVFSSGEGPLVRMGPCGEIRWAISRHFHHSIELDSQGRLVVPIVVYPKKADTVLPVRDDGFAIVSLDGKILEEYSVANIFISNGLKTLIYGIGIFEEDRIHLNDAQPIKAAINEAQIGDIVLSARNLSTIVLFRPSSGKLIWHKTGPWLNQHDVNQLDDGRYSVFGNDNVRNNQWTGPLVSKKESGIYLYDPITNEVSFPYKNIMKQYEIWSCTSGRASILKNGDVFIEQSDTQRLLRTSHDKLRWEYVNGVTPETVGAIHWSRYIPKNEVDLLWRENLKCR